MAQRTVVELTDDIDGSEATETVTFSLDGASYEIDLNEKNASELRDAIAPYVGVARRASGGGSAGGGRSSRGSSPARQRSSGDIDPKAVRAWGEENGIDVNARGRLKADVIEQYRMAHS